MTVSCRKDKNYPPDECCGECGAVDPLVIPGESVRQEIIDHFSAELDHNEKWVLLHKKAGEHGAAQRRREHCEKLLRFLEWLHLIDRTGKTCSDGMVIDCKKAVIVAAFGIQALGVAELLDRLENLYLAGVKAGYEAKG